MDPINILQFKLSRENIIEAQAEDFAEIIEESKDSPKFWSKTYQEKRTVNVYVTKRLTFDTNTNG